MAAPSEANYYGWVTNADAQAKSVLLADRDAFLAADPPHEEYEFLRRLRAQYAALPMQDAAPRVDFESFLPCNVLAQSDRMSMAHGLEVRVPFCDHHVVEAVAPISLAKKLPFGVPKGLMRFAMARDLPPRVLLHKKYGFHPPTAAWLRTDLREYVHDTLAPSSLRARGILHPERATALLEDFERGRSDLALTVWSMMVLETWLRWLKEAP
jgi:asparagine synthase (glutamine-hydrolysing)